MPYALPSKKKYPLNNRRQVHAAIAHFVANHSAYSDTAQAEIAQHLRGAAKRYDIMIHSRVILSR